jgi:hypothetical protein
LKRFVILLISGFAAGCFYTDSRFYCSDDENCRTTISGGLCLFDGDTGSYCAGPDEECPSGFRWMEGRNEIEYTCVDPALLLGSNGDASTDV